MYSLCNVLPEDSAAVGLLVATVLSEYGLQFDSDETDDDLGDLQTNYEGRGGVFQVVESANGLIVGCGGLFPMSIDTIELRKMYLLPEARGRGLGKRLLTHLLAEARRLGYNRVVLETNSVLKEAIGLYRHFGFVPVDREHLAGRCDQAWELRLTVLMEEGEMTQ
jgi:putative acetyltransferase